METLIPPKDKLLTKLKAISFAVSIGKAVVEDCKKDAAKCAGKIAFEALGAAATLGAGTAVGGISLVD